MKSQRDKEIKYNTSAISSKRKERIHSLERKLVLEFIMKYLAVLD